MHRKLTVAAIVLLVLTAATRHGHAQQAAPGPHPDVRLFFDAAHLDDDRSEAALEQIAASWRDGYTGIIRDLLRFIDPSMKVWRRLMSFLEDQTGQRFRRDLSRVQHWMWEQPYDPHPDLALFKGELYGQIDPRFFEFFPPGVKATIRLDEIDWGGVRVNGIPPLKRFS